MAASVTAAPVQIELHDGRKLLFSPLTDRDMMTLDEWVRAQMISSARASLAGVTDQALREETLAVAIRESTTVTFISDRGAKILATPAGLTMVLFLSVRRSHPEITIEDISPLLLDERNQKEVNRAFAHVNLPPERAAARPPRPARRRRR